MPTTRDELIADWRNRLAEATQSTTDVTPRAAWLTRLRTRLYHFLLSLYSDGNWQAADPSSRTNVPAQAAAEAEAPIRSQGKPAKDISTIRAVLATVADARPMPNIPGTLADGTGSEAWTVVATLRGGLHPYRCASLLKAKRVSARWLGHVDDVTVEVRAKDAANALQIIQANVNSLRVFRRMVVPTWPLFGVRLTKSAFRFTKWLDRWSFTLITLFHFSLVVPLACLWAGMMSSLKSPPRDEINLREDLFYDYYWLTLRCLVTLVVVLTWLRFHWLSREREASRAPKASGRNEGL